MTVDRDQMRRDAAAIANTPYHPGDAIPAMIAISVADHCLALLAELEQAEKACNICGKEWPNHEPACAYVGNALDLREAEARLAKVPALVEAGHKLNESCDDSDASDRWSEVVAEWNNGEAQ